MIVSLLSALLPPHSARTDCRELAPHVYDHDDSHDERDDVCKACRALEDDGVGYRDGARITLRLDGMAASEFVRGAHQRAERKCCLGAYRLEVAEAHDG